MKYQIKKSQHQRSDESLGLSGNGDKQLLAQIDDLIHHHQDEQPYIHNTLIRIKLLVDEAIGKGE